ncbi:MAG: hypothetical protein EA409_13225 [Saprospirales bacterium]|nr:MAG: hypothetical protein EA409_13225 [Saprospirales bacterium]
MLKKVFVVKIVIGNKSFLREITGIGEKFSDFTHPCKQSGFPWPKIQKVTFSSSMAGDWSIVFDWE